jgi:two-component system, LytTR family, response regulator LytT
MLKKMRVIIVDDRFLARDELAYLLSLHPDVELVGMCADTGSAWGLITSGHADGIFLDIDLELEGKHAGLDLAYRIDRLALPIAPWIVFTTGHEEYALPAHQVRPFGYLVKPLDDTKVAQVLDKIRKIQNTTSKMPLKRIEIKHKTLNKDEVVWCIKYIKPDDILYIQTNNNGNTVKVQLVNGEKLDGIHTTLSKWKTDYDLPDFMQIHRSHLVNLSHVNGLKPDAYRVEGYSVTFGLSSDELAVGKNYLDDLRKQLENA